MTSIVMCVQNGRAKATPRAYTLSDSKWLCTIVWHNTAQNRPDNFPFCPQDNHHCSDDVYLKEGGKETVWTDHETLRRGCMSFAWALCDVNAEITWIRTTTGSDCTKRPPRLLVPSSGTTETRRITQRGRRVIRNTVPRASVTRRTDSKTGRAASTATTPARNKQV